jgi:hypothetical protein
MNLNILDITPLPIEVSPITKRPPNTDEFNYKSILIDDDGTYYYWSRGVSLEIQKDEYESVKRNPKLFIHSTTHDLHQRVNTVLGRK